jgi:acetoin utilization deacetylase AcuC-like enzyme
MPLPEHVSNERYLRVLARALRRVARFFIIALGLDTAREDPTGTWSLQSEDFQTMGKMIGSLRLPTIVVQEGGYDTRVLGINARNFFEGLWEGAYTS